MLTFSIRYYLKNRYHALMNLLRRLSDRIKNTRPNLHLHFSKITNTRSPESDHIKEPIHLHKENINYVQ